MELNSLIGLTIIPGLLVLCLYYYLVLPYDFWQIRGIKGPKPVPFFGNTKDLLLRRVGISEFVQREYHRLRNEPMIGIFDRRKPVLLLNDPELIRDVLIKDFSAFSYRNLRPSVSDDPLMQNLFFLEPVRWRPLRQKLTPSFTSGKLKDMFYLLKECGANLESFLDKCVEVNPVIECVEMAARYSTDVIGVCAFGLNMNAIAEEDSEFRQIGRRIFTRSTGKFLKSRFREFAPWLFKIFAPFLVDRRLNDFFIQLTKQTIDYRRRNDVRRNDFIDLMMDIKDDPSKVNNIEMTDAFIAAQMFVFFVAGFETSSLTISHALYELAQNHSIQDKLRREIDELLPSGSGDLTYKNVRDLKYLKKVLSETLRKHPPLGHLMRCATKPYTFAGTNVTIPKGTAVWIPVIGIHRDSQIYPEPDKFDPERFDEESKKLRHPSFYLPFGAGPRHCIGGRFANYQTKVGLIKILQRYKVDVCEETCIPYARNPKALTHSPLFGIKLKFTKLK